MKIYIYIQPLNFANQKIDKLNQMMLEVLIAFEKNIPIHKPYKLCQKNPFICMAYYI